MPAATDPAQREFDVIAHYDFVDGVPQPVVVPASNAQLTVLALQTSPGGLDERFVAGRRMLLPSPGTQQLRLHCRYRVYSLSDETTAGRANPATRLQFPSTSRLSPRATRIQARIDHLATRP